jgi:ATP-dependent Clp protease ATP-binding subunit ClpC
VGDRFLPDKAVDLIDEAASAVRLPLISLPEEIRSLEERVSQLKQEQTEAEKTGDRVKARILKSKLDDREHTLTEKKDEYNMKKGQTTSEVTIEIIKDIVSRWTGIPVSKITGSEMEKLANLEKIMHERLIDQEAAVSVIAQAVRRGRAGLKSTQRPIGSFVFLGPTGVGKTELAKTLAEILFGQEEAMIRFDMTEYMEKHEVAKLLGAPPGYVGYEEGGKLTEAVRRRPYAVVLFDEVEKAHPDIFNILLQVLDDGRLTDGKGRQINFKNTIIIMTSNIGSDMILDWGKRRGEIGFVHEDAKTSDKQEENIRGKVMELLRDHFRPEFLNRVDEIVMFQALIKEDLAKIVDLQIAAVVKRLQLKRITLTFTDKARELVAEKGYDPSFGARPLKRAIQDLILDELALKMIKHEIKEGESVKIDAKKEKIVMTVS